MLPIEPGCRALLINAGENSGEVLVGNCLGEQPNYDAPPHWEIDKTFMWSRYLELFGIKGLNAFVTHETRFAPEQCLMRIDGLEKAKSKTTTKSKSKEPVLDDA